MEISRPIPEILLCRKIFDRSKELIDYVEQAGNWVEGKIFVTNDTPDSMDGARNKNLRDTDLSCELHYNPLLDSAVFNAFETAQLEYCEHFTFNVRSGSGYHVLRYRPGQFYTEHIDQGWGCLDRVLSGVLFLNDDFKGGELYFPRQELTIEPEPGMLILFPSNFLFPHLVRPVKTGIRYSVVSWMS